MRRREQGGGDRTKIKEREGDDGEGEEGGEHGNVNEGVEETADPGSGQLVVEGKEDEDVGDPVVVYVQEDQAALRDNEGGENKEKEGPCAERS